MGISKNFLQTIQLAVQNLEGYWPGCLMSAIWEVVPGWGSTDIGPYWKVLRWKTQYSHNIQCLSQYSHNIRQNVCQNVPIISKTPEFVATGWLNVGIGFCTFWREHALRLDWNTSMYSHSAEMFQLKLNFHMARTASTICWNSSTTEHDDGMTGQLKCAVCWTLVRFPNFVQ